MGQQEEHIPATLTKETDRPQAFPNEYISACRGFCSRIEVFMAQWMAWLIFDLSEITIRCLVALGALDHTPL